MDGTECNKITDRTDNGSRVISVKLLNRFLARQGTWTIKKSLYEAGYFFKAWFSFLFGGHLQISRSCNGNNEEEDSDRSPESNLRIVSCLYSDNSITPTFSFVASKKEDGSFFIEIIFVHRRRKNEFNSEKLNITESGGNYFWLNGFRKKRNSVQEKR